MLGWEGRVARDGLMVDEGCRIGAAGMEPNGAHVCERKNRTRSKQLNQQCHKNKVDYIRVGVPKMDVRLKVR